ncbi:MAG: chemotaxis protein CheA, partial [Terracidiphilus sp.]
EKVPEDREAINTVFRAFHTIKGLSAFLDLSEMRDVAHETETLLDMVRSERLRVTSEIVDIVLAAADFLKVSLASLEATLMGSAAGPVPEKADLVERIRRGTKGELLTPRMAADINAAVIGVETNLPNTPATDSIAPERRTSGADRRAQITESHSVKVDTGKLDFLVEMAGEMVVAQSIVQHHPDLVTLQSPAVQRSLAQLARITTDLQKTAMSMRMVPVGGLFQKMSRLVRDLSRKTGKQAELEAIGADTELDRNVVEELADPLMHMVRNAADHGLESVKERHAAGKDPTGHIRLSASHQAGHIVIEIADDGRGLIRERILDKARRMGLTEDGTGLSDREVFSFIFHPGFSTATVVTDVSGRGVGMDVVKKQIQKLRGHVDIESIPGKGTSFFLRLPLTLAMIDGLVVGVGAERYVIPIHSVREMLRPSEAMLFTLENREEMAMVRNSLLPIVRLYQRFGVKPRSELATESLLVVAEAAGRSFCLMVDDLIGKQEVVIKSLGETLKDVHGVAGGAILGDGRVGLILDIEGVYARENK